MRCFILLPPVPTCILMNSEYAVLCFVMVCCKHNQFQACLQMGEVDLHGTAISSQPCCATSDKQPKPCKAISVYRQGLSAPLPWSLQARRLLMLADPRLPQSDPPCSPPIPRSDPAPTSRWSIGSQGSSVMTHLPFPACQLAAGYLCNPMGASEAHTHSRQRQAQRSQAGSHQEVCRRPTQVLGMHWLGVSHWSQLHHSCL